MESAAMCCCSPSAILGNIWDEEMWSSDAVIVLLASDEPVSRIRYHGHNSVRVLQLQRPGGLDGFDQFIAIPQVSSVRNFAEGFVPRNSRLVQCPFKQSASVPQVAIPPLLGCPPCARRRARRGISHPPFPQSPRMFILGLFDRQSHGPKIGSGNCLHLRF